LSTFTAQNLVSYQLDKVFSFSITQKGEIYN
jgi:hypothetical protein